MPKGYKLTIEEVISIFIKIHGNKYDYSKFIYTSDKIKSTIICPKHGEFLQSYSLHKSYGCKKCANSTKKYSQDEIIFQFKEIHGTKYNYDKFIYNGIQSKGIIICPEHGEFLQTPNNHKSGYGCKLCTKLKRTFNLNEILLQFKEMHVTKYNYDKFVYINTNTKGIIRCPDHGEFLQTPAEHKKGSGCPKCAGRNPTIEHHIRAFNNVHPNIYDYSFVVYKNTNVKIEIFCKKHGSFWQRPYLHKIGQGCPQCKINKKEKFLIELSKEYNLNYLYNDRTLIKPLELDILFPDYKLAIEHNGLVWHSFGINKSQMLNNYNKLDKTKHLNKTRLVEEKDFQLFHIREDQLKDSQKKDIWKSMILNKCRISHKIHARKLQVVDLTEHNGFVKQFLEDNHLQGQCPAKIKLGLQDPKTGTVYSVMTFGASRFNKNIQWELLRFCNLKFHNVRGAASKLLKAFERWQQPESLISYANRDWSQGNLYRNLGFNFSHASEPNYVYTNTKGIIISRQQVQKHKLQTFLESRNQYFDPDISERDNMINNGYRIFYDTGNLVYTKQYY